MIIDFQGYRKPARGASPSPTRHLCLSGVGEGQSIPPQNIRLALAPFGKVVNVFLPEKCSFCFASFGSSEDATKALSALSGKPCPELGGRKILVRFASMEGEGDEKCAPPLRGPPPRKPLEATLSVPSDVLGLSLLPDFVTPEEEEEVILKLDSLGGWDSMIARAVKHFGHTFSYSNLRADSSADPLPSFLEPFLHRMVQALGPSILPREPDQLTVNSYSPGDGIAPHVDTHSAFDGTILSLSLGSGCAMDFRCSPGKHRALYLPRRSLLVMSGDSRYLWTHGIAGRKSDVIDGLGRQLRGRRVSLTLRRVRQSLDCNCEFPTVCDAAQRKRWAQARRTGAYIVQPGPIIVPAEPAQDLCRVLQLYMPNYPHGIVLDTSCQWHRCIVPNAQQKNLVVIGGIDLDKSWDAMSLPCRNAAFDAVIWAGVFPGSLSRDRRILAFFEMGRVLRDRGLACFVVCSAEEKEELVRLQASVQGFGTDILQEGAIAILRRSRHMMRIVCCSG
jgi:alkylated DNA repair protein alkB family protein 8